MEKNIDNIILSYLRGKATRAEQKLLCEWVETSEKNARYLSDIKAISSCIGECQQEREPVRPRRSVFRMLGYAVCAACAVLLSVTAIRVAQKRNVVLVENHETSLLMATLPDHTRIWLKEGSYFTYNKKTFQDKRLVHLVGDADFDVVKSAGSQFHVQTSSLDIVVLGTVFNVRDYADETSAETTLAEGSISLKVGEGGNRFRVAEGQRVIYDLTSHDINVESVDAEPILNRRYGIITICHSSIHEIADRIMNDYAVQLTVRKTGEIEDGSYTLSYNVESSIEDVLAMVEAVSGYKFEVIKSE